MAVLVEAVSVIVRRDAIELRFAGGWEAFAKNIPTSAVCNDGDLVRVGFMDPSDAGAYVASLEAAGLTSQRDGSAVDLVIVNQMKGPAAPSPWLKFDNLVIEGKTLSVCWLAGRESKTIVAPPGWKYEKSLSATGPGFISASQIGDRLKFLRRQDNVEVYLDLQTNKEVYVGRPQIKGDVPAALETQISAMFHEATAIEAKGPVKAPKFFQKADARYQRLNGEMLPAIQRIAQGPGREMASAHFIHGVVLRLLDRRPEAVQAFLKARELRPCVASVLRDLVRCLAEMSKPRDALPYAREAAQLAPAALGNLAACLMQCDKPDEARTVIERALAIDPNDAVNQHIRNRLVKIRQNQ